MKSRLSAAAIPAGIFLLLYLSLTLLMIAQTEATLAPIGYLRLLLFLVIAILLFIRRRFVTIGILAAVQAASDFATVVNVLPTVSDGSSGFYFFMTLFSMLAFLALAIIVFRRVNGPARGPWWLLLFPIALSLFFTTGQMLSMLPDDSYIASIMIGSLMQDYLLWTGVILTAVAFVAGRPAAPAVSAPVQAAPVQTPPVQTVSVQTPPVQTAPKAAKIEEAEVEILED